MPYITQKDRRRYEPDLLKLKMKMKQTTAKGDLTYLVYSLGLEFFKKRGLSYTNMSMAIGALTDAAEEIRRRHLNPYEDTKIIENGDVI